MAYTFSRQHRFNFKQNLKNLQSTSIDYEKWKNHSHFKAAKSVVIGRARRSSRVATDGPGPAAYQTPTYIAREAPRAILIGRPKSSRIKTNPPGPGAYEVEKVKNILPHNPQFSFTHSITQQKVDMGPGPTTYYKDLSQMSKTGPVIAFPRAKKDSLEEHKDIPGPGQYKSVMTETSVQYGFGHEQKFKHENDDLRVKTEIPGPGAYISEDRRNIRGGVISKSRERAEKRSSIPGPGAYNIEFVKHRSPEATIGNSPRSLTGRTFENAPGPTSYIVPPVEIYKKMNTSSILFGKDRKFVKLLTDTPGPGAYTHESATTSFLESSKRGITIPGRHTTEKIQPGPGPQSYQPKPVNLPRQPRTAFSRQKKNRMLIQNIPGPGKYNTEADRKVRSFYFPREQRRQSAQLTPGPGQYKLKPLIGQLPVYSLNTSQDEILFV